MRPITITVLLMSMAVIFCFLGFYDEDQEDFFFTLSIIDSAAALVILALHRDHG